MTKFAELAFDFQHARANFEGDLEDAGLLDFNGIGWDYYDCSLELERVGNDVRLTEAQQRVIFDAGFAKVYVNHLDGWETHYSWHGAEFKANRGWRRRYVSDPSATTTNVIAGAANPGYYEISYWPDGWEKARKWLDTGYMRIVPDPLDRPSSSAPAAPGA